MSLVSREGSVARQIGSIKELRVTIRVRNNRLIELREELGLNQRAAAERIGVSIGLYNGLECMRRSPLDRHGDWGGAARKIAAFHGLSCDDIFPESVMAVDRPVVEKRFDGVEVSALSEFAVNAALPPDEIYDWKEAGEVLGKIGRERLHPRERMIHRMHLQNEVPVGEVGKALGISGTRVQQLHQRGLMKVGRCLETLGAGEVFREMVGGAVVQRYYVVWAEPRDEETGYWPIGRLPDEVEWWRPYDEGQRQDGETVDLCAVVSVGHQDLWSGIWKILKRCWLPQTVYSVRKVHPDWKPPDGRWPSDLPRWAEMGWAVASSPSNDDHPNEW